ncbi:MULTISPECIES: hypothetical protein [Cellulophaga]|uniref:Uncharacterized protein n=3 Tax=Cellulophaga TaxID=104264 RepID=F0REH5_CELLC|nr:MULTISPECIES: hypothetical protein [Cellulophaga]EWH13396.1 hypothetical protein KLA_09709 [Cellulophaga geojensis KL-A]ADY30990.1 hypothetical protein Celly_3173 [Cellulophaga lytica DSM 7489]MDO6852870.1 hypothetical protein [Cellulophaga lytica]TVZ09685.1 hypothetical protein JM80_2214 [Cellulophaga sp. RHA_52]WQG78097.1 hypothetical protein SR888_04035 [Cellulophaga lytica]
MIDIIRLMFEFGSLIVFSLLHIIIYPSFNYFSKEELVNWYRDKRDQIYLFAILLGPIHLTSIILQLVHKQDLYTIVSSITICALWVQHYVIIEANHAIIIKGVGSLEKAKRAIKNNNLIRIIILTFLLGWTILKTVQSTNFWLVTN